MILKTKVPAFRNDDMIDQWYPDRQAALFQPHRQLDIRIRRSHIAAWMIVRYQQIRRIHQQCLP